MIPLVNNRAGLLYADFLDFTYCYPIIDKIINFNK